MVPFFHIKFFIISGIPLMLMVIILEFRYSFLGIIIYSMICFFVNILPGSYQLFATFGYKSDFSQFQWIFLNSLTNFFIPCFSYLFLSFSNNKNINNFDKRYKIFLFLLLMIVFQTISKTFNGYYLYFDTIKEKLNLQNKYSIFLIIMLLNLFPNLTTNSFNLLVCLRILFYFKNFHYLDKK
ncbi:hypothetical protein ATP_00496 [Candidatus Phytoplasma mali]|uniref:Uncharacterized protein n=2 Tax=Apple proliferation phytoplasma TaxID=37692 RepID=B3R025_PHYMT|nr:hypothetical protein ATP_00002 [Candidatus Phytoplasma mali]CAP18683.1 hypothetical protein ATP_00496 [Candidatus Phytoplasma mali]